jgi:hypothetical protein
MKKIIPLLMMLAVSLSLSTSLYAFDWQYYGDCSGDVNSGLKVGISNWNALEDDLQPIQISGAGALLPAGYSKVNVNFDFAGYTWDSYNAEFMNNGDEDGGYLDVFAVVLSDKGYYWNLDTSKHPLETNPDLLMDDKLYCYWGGKSYHDSLLETSFNPISLSFTTDPSKQYYVSLFLQTNEDTAFSSWGTISNVQVTPEPISSALFLLGAGVFAGARKLRKKII